MKVTLKHLEAQIKSVISDYEARPLQVSYDTCISQIQGMGLLFPIGSKHYRMAVGGLALLHDKYNSEKKPVSSLHFLQSGDACRPPVQSPDAVGQGGN